MSTGKRFHRVISGAVVIALTALGFVALPEPAQAAGSSDRLFWSAATTGANQLWGSTAATVPSASALPSGSALSGLYRSIATDGTKLFFSDGTNLVRTELNGTGKTTIVSGVSSPESIVVAGGQIYYTGFSTGIWTVGASATNAVPNNILGPTVVPSGFSSPIASSGFDGVAVSGTTIYAQNYNDGLYTATLNGTSVVSALTVNSSTRSGVTKLLASGSTLYAAGSANQILSTTNSSANISAWSTINTASVAGTVYSLALLDSTLYYTVGTKVASVHTDGTSNTLLSTVGQFGSVWSIAVAPPETFTVTYDGNGNTGGNVPVDSSNPYASGSTVTVLGNTGNLVKTDNQFLGWILNDPSPISGTYKPVGSTFSITQNTILYTRWAGGPLAYSSTSGGSSTSTMAFTATPIGQTTTMTVFVKNTGASTNLGVPAAGSGVSIITNNCPTAFTPLAQNAECSLTLSWTASGSLSTQLTYPYGGPSNANLALTGAQPSPARTPMFDTPASTSSGFTVNVTNWDTNWTWSPSVTVGSVSAGTPSGASLPLTVTGLAASASASVSVTSARTNYLPGSAVVSGTALANSGGGGSPTPTSQPTSVPSSPTTVTPVFPNPLAPTETASAAGLQPGGTFITDGGQIISATTAPNKTSGSVTTSGDGWAMAIGGQTSSGKPQPTSSNGVVQVPLGGRVAVSGKGYAPGTMIQLYLLNPALLVGTFTVDPDGTFRGTASLAPTLKPGSAVVQANGYATGGSVRSYSLGISILKDSTGTVRSRTSTVYFAEGSSRLHARAKAVLMKFARSVPKTALSVSVVSTGYVQGTPDNSNDFTLSTARASKVAAQLKADKLMGRYYITGHGVANELGALGRKVIVTVSYKLQ